MGKLQSKHVHRTGRGSMEATECFLVNAQLNRAFEEQIWKKRSSQDLANYNMDESLSELSICLDTKCGHVPLRVELPPQVGETDTSRVLKLDQGEGNDDVEKGDKANNLSIEEFECGVQFEGTENSKQEWSFTLYDFDGHGRITKEDLASLLKALYDAVGSSIRLPPNGAKTLKLRLTVGQDRTQVHTLTTSKPLTGGKRKENSSKGKSSQDVKGTTKQQQFSRLNNLTRTSVKCNNQTQDANGQGQGQGPNPGEVTEGSARKQLSPEDQQQLVELVQENMERNHVKQLRRHHSEYHNSDKPQHKRRHRNRPAAASGQNKAAAGTTTTTTTTTAAALALAEVGCRPAESQDRRNYYLDLAGVDSSNLNNAKLWNNPSLPGGVGVGVVSGSGGHHRSRSHDVSAGGGVGKCDNSKRESENVQRVSAHQQFLQQNHLRSRSFDPQDTAVRAAKSGGGGCHATGGSGAAAAAEPSAAGGVGGGGGGSPHKHSRFRPVSLPGHVPASVSPHYHRRHRHREKDHDLAMQQVAAWIEREHSWDLDGERSGGNGGGVVVQRHHHHHIHEHHHHHHYHHYYEA